MVDAGRLLQEKTMGSNLGVYAPICYDEGVFSKNMTRSNDHAAIGQPGGPQCALVDLHGTLRAFAENKP